MSQYRRCLRKHNLVAIERTLREKIAMTAHHAPHTPIWKKVISLPKTRLGWFSVGLTAVFLLYLFALIIDGSALEAENLPGIGPFMFGVTMAAAATGLVAVLRRGERSILMILPVLIGLATLAMNIGEFLHSL
jgi:hypothetical protein